MKSKTHLNSESDSEARRSVRQEASPVETSSNPKNRISGRPSSGGKRNSPPSPSPGPSRTGSTGPGRTPQTKRRELSLNQAEKNSPTGSPRNRDTVKPQTLPRKSTQTRSKTDSHSNGANEETCRKSSNSSQDSGIGRDTKLVRQDRNKSGQSVAKTRNNPIIRTVSPETVEIEVSHRKRFEELCDFKNVELGIVKVPREVLEELIHKGSIENYYDVDPIPVASGLFATVRKCTHKETGVEYAAKFSSRVRCGADCTTEVLHEIALLSVCAESSKIVHLKDVFQNKHEIILVLEYAPGGDFQSVLDDDMVPFEEDVQGFILQVLEALSYIHQRNIAHLDIKPQNIVLMSEFPNCEIKLCDLEVSRVIQETEHIREIIGTPDYVAPEILSMDPITLAADIWSLGVLAYVLLTGFSPFGGDTDQETLRNITIAPLDFPAELFEGVSDGAKDFITQCLNRNPRRRPTVEECLLHPWISQTTEPPSPSPLMLKIPAPDHYVSSQMDHSPSGSSRRSCQTCRDKITERKRYLSKSREAIFEKVSNSNLKKSLSKSRERLCDMRLTLSKSRDYLNESKIASRSQEKFFGFKSLSKSQEVLSQALGGSMKRMVNGAVSDISPAHLPINPRVYLDTPDSCDFVILPGSSVLMSHSDFMSLSSSSIAESPQNPVESGRSTPASSCSTQTLPAFKISEPKSDCNSNAKPTKSIVETLVEVSEDEAEDENENMENSQKREIVYRRERDTRSCETYICAESKTSRRKSSHELRNSMTAKEEKNSINYETKQSMSRSASVDGIYNNNRSKNNISKSETAEVAVQVNLSKCNSSPNLLRKERMGDRSDFGSLNEKLSSLHADDDILDGNTRPGTANTSDKRQGKGFSHEETLGEESKRYSWREELERFRNMKKPLGVSDLIDTFSSKTNSRNVSSDDLSLSGFDSFTNKRRGSLQIQINSKELAKLSERAENEKSKMAAKQQRRKSTSAIMAFRPVEIKMPDIAEDTGLTAERGMEEKETENIYIDAEKQDREKEALDEEDKPEKETENEKDKREKDYEENKQENIEKEEFGQEESVKVTNNPNKGRVYLEKVNERKRTWDYFEINHPKAISDKKLEQLKAKYTRRKTETSLQAEPGLKIDPDSNSNQPVKIVPSTTTRTQSLSLIKGVNDASRRNLDLAWDPLTGESIGLETESVDSGKGGENTREPSVCSTEEFFRQVSISSNPEELAKSDRTPTVDKEKLDLQNNRKNSFLNNLPINEQIIPTEDFLECFIDPFTGQYVTHQVSKPNERSSEPRDDKNAVRTGHRSLRVKLSEDPSLHLDDGIGSLPDTPTDLEKSKVLSLPPQTRKDGCVHSTGEAGHYQTSDEAGLCAAPEDRHSDTSDEGGLRASSTVDSSDSSSDRLSAVFIEEPTTEPATLRTDSNGIRRGGLAAVVPRPKSNSGVREWAKATKVCTGSFSRGIERFRSESPVPAPVQAKNRSEN